jgi:hypothetical protein
MACSYTTAHQQHAFHRVVIEGALVPPPFAAQDRFQVLHPWVFSDETLERQAEHELLHEVRLHPRGDVSPCNTLKLLHDTLDHELEVVGDSPTRLLLLVQPGR